MQDGTPWPGNNTRDHPGMIQVVYLFIYRFGWLNSRDKDEFLQWPFLLHSLIFIISQKFIYLGWYYLGWYNLRGYRWHLPELFAGNESIIFHHIHLILINHVKSSHSQTMHIFILSYNFIVSAVFIVHWYAVCICFLLTFLLLLSRFLWNCLSCSVDWISMFISLPLISGLMRYKRYYTETKQFIRT